MADQEWENLPERTPQRPVSPLGSGWLGFTADPRPPANQVLRAGDADRDYATALVAQARADGRLTPAEADERTARAAGARTLGELLPLVSDLVAVPGDGGYRSHDRGRRFVRGGAFGWVGLAVMFNVIWLMTSLSAGRLLYYWPMWPMVFIALPLVMGIIANRGSQPRPPDQPRELPPGQDLR